jgi:hypothetical protein
VGVKQGGMHYSPRKPWKTSVLTQDKPRQMCFPYMTSPLQSP